jgi:hypothetical protein
MAILFLVGCSAAESPGPTTKTQLCSQFDALGKELHRGVPNHSEVSSKVRDLAGSAENYKDDSQIKASAGAIGKIALGDDPSMNELLNARAAVAKVCGHRLGLGMGTTATRESTVFETMRRPSIARRAAALSVQIEPSSVPPHDSGTSSGCGA